MRADLPKSAFAYDRDAETSPRRLAILVGIGAVLLALTLWTFSGDETSAPQHEQLSPQSAPVIRPEVALANPAPSVSPSQLTLHGVTGTGTNGAAIIDVAGQGQRLVRIGRDVVPGLRLVTIGGDHVILQDRGNEIRLSFP